MVTEAVTGSFNAELSSRLHQAKVLVVGAGGVGCELLKNLVLAGFQDIEIVDLDTIDVSNLNRQFLFHKQHVGQSKVQVARESALAFNPNVRITAHHGTIMSSEFGLEYFKKFDVVMNALDNQGARSHVNRMCLAADIPLIESGTAGFMGQVQVIKKGLSQCYECTPKAPQKTFPNCTIRNTPSEPIHCIVWAKHLFNQLFGEADEDEEVSPDTADPELAGSAATEAMKAQQDDAGNVVRVSTRRWAEMQGYNPKKLFTKLFKEDIEYLLSMKDLWEKRGRLPPSPLLWDNLPDAAAGSSRDTHNSDQVLWSMSQCAEVFERCVKELHKRLSDRGDGGNTLVWDKDDDVAMDFVAACANLRSHIFSIPEKSRFHVKSMAGNIIPAIATSNAIIAGCIVLQALHILEGNWHFCHNVALNRSAHALTKKLMLPEKLAKPNPKCYVCSPKNEVVLQVNVEKMHVHDLEEKVLKGKLSMVAPDVMVEGKGVILISSEEGETEANLDKTLQHFGIASGVRLACDDFLQNYQLVITVMHKAEFDPEGGGDGFEIVGDISQIKAEANGEASEEKTKEEEEEKPQNVEEDVIVDAEVWDTEEAPSRKRKVPSAAEEGLPVHSKKRRTLDNGSSHDCHGETQHDDGNSSGFHEEPEIVDIE